MPGAERTRNDKGRWLQRLRTQFEKAVWVELEGGRSRPQGKPDSEMSHLEVGRQVWLNRFGHDGSREFIGDGTVREWKWFLQRAHVSSSKGRDRSPWRAKGGSFMDVGITGQQRGAWEGDLRAQGEAHTSQTVTLTAEVLSRERAVLPSPHCVFVCPVPGGWLTALRSRPFLYCFLTPSVELGLPCSPIVSKFSAGGGHALAMYVHHLVSSMWSPNACQDLQARASWGTLLRPVLSIAGQSRRLIGDLREPQKRFLKQILNLRWMGQVIYHDFLFFFTSWLKNLTKQNVTESSAVDISKARWESLTIMDCRQWKHLTEKANT